MCVCMRARVRTRVCVSKFFFFFLSRKKLKVKENPLPIDTTSVFMGYRFSHVDKCFHVNGSRSDKKIEIGQALALKNTYKICGSE